MTLFNAILIGFIPAALVVLVGLFIRSHVPKETAGRRFLTYLLVVTVLLWIGVISSLQLSERGYNQTGYFAAYMLAPVYLGVVALILVNFRLLVGLRWGEKFLFGLIGLALLSIPAVFRSESSQIIFYLLFASVLLAATWTLVRRHIGWAISLTLLAFLGMIAINLAVPNPNPPAQFTWIFTAAMIAAPGLVVACSAALVELGPQAATFQVERARASRFPAYLRMGVAVFLLGCLCFSVYWASVWDQTSDGLGGLALTLLASPVAIAAGMVMALAAKGRRRIAGMIFAVLVPLAIIQAFHAGWAVSYHKITEARAARIQHALESYYARNGHYPDRLNELVPRDLLLLQQPVILRSEGWCYQGEGDGYNLAAFYREYFSSPLSLKVYAASRALPEAGGECQERLVELKTRYDPPPFYEHEVVSAPTEPLPTSISPVEKSPLEPLLRDSTLMPGSWSPDGSYYLFAVISGAAEQRYTTLSFLDVGMGTLCPVEERFEPEPDLRSRHAWVSGGRLLFLESDGEMVLLTPCQPGLEHLAERYPVPFDQIAYSEPASSRVLLHSESAYWILDRETLQVNAIDAVSPNPYEAHWDRFAWSHNADRLAIARLNGRDRTEGSTLFIVAADTGQVLLNMPLEYATDQSAPSVDWLSGHELLIHGANALEIMNFNTDPPQRTHVMADLFNLDLAYPDELTAMALIVDRNSENYHLALRANHPRNKSIYMLHAETGVVEVIQTDIHALLIFPDGQFEQLPAFETQPSVMDVYEVFWVDTDRQSQRLVVQGHTPRDDPHLYVKYFPETTRMAFGSSQGVSLVSFPQGDILAFWALAGGRSAYLTAPAASPALVAIMDFDGLYYIPLPPESTP